jgi:uncharacterized secreted protein with C-terminal beta-propeller domain
MKSDKLLYVKIIAVVIVAVFALSILPSAQTPASSTQIKKFSSEAELNDFLSASGSSGSLTGSNMRTLESTASAPMAAGDNSQKAVSGDYSTTNIQVAGVDEADFVKNDGKYIYTIAGSNVVITDAYPAEGMTIVSTINLSGSNPGQIYINGDKLVVFGNVYNYGPMPLAEGKVAADVGIMPPRYNQPTTYIKVYDVSDRANPLLTSDLVFNGTYYESRMIGNQVYAILTVPTYGNEIPVFSPYQRGFPEIYYFNMPSYSYQYTNIVSLDINNGALNNKVFLLGYSTNMYVSENNIYLVYQKQLGQDYILYRMLDEVYRPLLPAELNAEIDTIRNSDKSDYRKMGEIQLAMQDWMMKNPDYQNTLNVNYKQMQEKTETIYNDYYRLSDFSVVHKIAISNGEINYVGKGEVPGTPLNQFSMDENNGYFRIATTTNQWRGNQTNNLYVLDGSMNVVGRLENLAPGERIYSARFMGDRAYLVTFVRMDPLFVIDLSDPANPRVLGELKIPGVSEYLHPYDETHIIGVGQNTQETDGRVRFKGLKISLFDVSDVTNPQEVANYELGDRGTYSEALYDHKAFLFSKEKNLLVIPVSLYEEKTGQMWGDFVWQGAYAFNIDLTGISVKGRVTHANSTDKWSNNIRRSLYMDDVLYTVSDGKIAANSLSDFAAISSVDLPVNYYYYGYSDVFRI